MKSLARRAAPGGTLKGRGDERNDDDYYRDPALYARTVGRARQEEPDLPHVLPLCGFPGWWGWGQCPWDVPWGPTDCAVETAAGMGVTDRPPACHHPHAHTHVCMTTEACIFPVGFGK
jgi:hypothetical protein